MKYINFAALKQTVDSGKFKKADPYPYIEISDSLTPEGYAELIANLPDISLFEKSIGEYRIGGQQSHDRYSLEYSEIDPKILPAAWREFLTEIQSPAYHKFIKKLYGVRSFKIRPHWHYAFQGCSVSPHCDSKKKLGSHIFYLNTENDWNNEWGGGTLVLKPKNNVKIDNSSAPIFEEFDIITCLGPTGNRSMLFESIEDAWHGVKELTCPESQEGYLRKVFIVVLYRQSLRAYIKSNLKSRFQAILDQIKKWVGLPATK